MVLPDMNTLEFTTTLNELVTRETTHQNLPVPVLVEKSLSRKEGILTSTGALRATTGKYTGRSPEDKFIVEDASVKKSIDWGKVNKPFSPENFDKLYKKVLQYL